MSLFYHTCCKSKKSGRKLLFTLLAFGMFFAGANRTESPGEGDSKLKKAGGSTLLNGDFESPANFKDYKFFNHNQVSGWSSESSNNIIELWKSGYRGVDAAEGNQFLEVNAKSSSAVFQDFATQGGDVLNWQFYHRGRAGTDKVAFLLGPPDSPVTQGEFTSGKTSWELYTGTYVVPEGQNVTRIVFSPLKTAATGNTIGNFIDGVKLTIQHNSPPDSDRDGVPDASDNCPDTPIGNPVDENGCELPLNGAEICDVRPGTVALSFLNGPLTGELENWSVDTRSFAKIVKFPNGIVWAIYTAVYEDKKQKVNLVLKNKRNWTEWEALGREYIDKNGNDHTAWNYYEVDEIRSYRIQLWDDDTLQVRHFPSNYKSGVQMGLGAAGNDQHGLSSFAFMPDQGSIEFTFDNCIEIKDTDGDGLTDESDADDDGDGISDQNEGNGTIDFDQDGIPDSKDLDSDNDGIPDNVEGQSTRSYQAPSGTDADNNGIDDTYGANGISPFNKDGADNPDFRDIDSDNDGVYDQYESGLPTLSGTDTDRDGLDDAIDDNNAAFGSLNAGLSQPAVMLLDTDNDVNGIGDVNFRDTDDDNDNVPSSQEGNDPNGNGNPDDANDNNNNNIPDFLDPNEFQKDTDGDGIGDNLDTDDDNDGISDVNEGDVAIDTDNDGLPDSVDLDSDNDGIPDNIEAQLSNAYQPPGGNDVDGDGMDDAYGANGLTPVDTDSDGTWDMRDTDSDNDSVLDSCESGLQAAGNVDVDEDGLDDNIDTDNNAWGPVNGGINNPAATLQDNDQDVLLSGDLDYRDNDDDNDSILTQFELFGSSDGPSCPTDAEDSDNDGTPDYKDPDDDGDGVLSIFENPDPDNNGDPADGQDTDNDDVADYLDDDDDGDSINSKDEGNDPNNDGDPADALDTDSDQTPDYLDNSGSSDTDGDGIDDLADADDDGDGIKDDVEGEDDIDGDGIVNRLDLDSDGDGLPDNIEAQATHSYLKPSGSDDNKDGIDNSYGNGLTPVDTDGDGDADYLDIDADDDGPEDNFESGQAALSGKDIDKDGLDDVVDAAVGTFGPPNAWINNPKNDLLDTDGDAQGSGDLNYRDLEDDGDDVRTDMENVDPNFDGNPDDAVDSDGDGTPDYLDNDDDGDGVLTIYEEPNPDGDPDFDPEDARDTDDDGTPNYLDVDDDGDGIPSRSEGNDPNGNGQPEDATTPVGGTVPFYLQPDEDSDTDGDGVPDVIDVDDDGDGILDSVEGKQDLDNDGRSNSTDLDSDDDGIPDNIETQETAYFIQAAAEDSDGDGLADVYEPDGLSIELDTDNDGKPDLFDKESDGDGVLDENESGLPALIGVDQDFDGLDDAVDPNTNQFGPENGGIDNPLEVLRDSDSDAAIGGDLDYRDNNNYAPGGINRALLLWLRADTSTSTYDADAPLSEWIDQSKNQFIATGDGNSQPRYSLRPEDAINGYPVAVFDGDDDFMQISNGLFEPGETNDAFTVFIVNRTKHLRHAPQLYQKGGDNTENAGTRFEVTTPGLTPGVFADFVAGDAASSPGNLDSDAADEIEGEPLLWSMTSSTEGGPADGPLRKIYKQGLLVLEDDEASTFFSKNSDFFIGGGADRPYYKGSIAEIIIYKDELTDDERLAVQNYLALKYCLHLPVEANTMYSYADYGDMVIGLGRDDAMGLDQRAGKHVDDIMLTTSPDLEDKSFLLWGNNGGALTTSSLAAPVGNVTKILNRTWRVSEAGESGQVNIALDLKGIDGFESRDPEKYALLVSNSDTPEGFQTLLNGSRFDSTMIHFEKVQVSNSQFLFVGVGNAIINDVVGVETVPVEFSLAQNYPNPFNPTTQIQYSLPTAEHVTIRIFNIRGQQVMRLFDGRQDAGKHKISFSGRNFASGIYFYRLKAGKFTATKKMTFLK